MPREPARLIWLAALALATPAAAVPTKAAPAAAPAAPPAPASAIPALPPGEAEIAAALQAALSASEVGDCAKALTTLDPLLARATDPQARFVLQLARSGCLAMAGRSADLDRAYEELAKIQPDDPRVRNLGVLIAAAAGNFTLAGERLAAFAEQRPQELATLTGHTWRGIWQELLLAGQRPLRQRIALALARAGWQPVDLPNLPEITEAVAADAMDALIARNELPEARAMLARITSPSLLFGMAMERSYQPLWPEIEAAIGPAGARTIDAFAAEKLEENARNPTSPRARRDAVQAYLLLGRDADAAALAAGVQAADGMDEDAVVVLRYRARALEGLGKRDLAIQTLESLVALNPEKTPALPSGVIDLVELYHEAGRSEDELRLARTMLARGDKAFSAWGRGWLKRSEVCALSGLKQGAAAKTAGDALLAAAAQNEAAAVEGLLCAGRVEEAAKLAVATLARPDGASLLADQFQPAEALGSAPSRLRALWQGFLTRPDVRRAFEKVARILPRSLWPSRTPRSIPRLPEAPPAADTV